MRRGGSSWLVAAVAALCAVASGCRCGGEPLAPFVADLRVEPARVDFGPVFLGHRAYAGLSLTNVSNGPLSVRASIAAPFFAPAEVALVQGEQAWLPLEVSTDVEGPLLAELELAFADQQTRVPVVAVAVAVPPCGASGECRTGVFLPDAGRCVDSPLPDGTACGAANLCLRDGRCLGGRCVGEAVGCDDGNACTEDSCLPATGCAHRDVSAQCPKPEDVCLVATCEPTSGCGLAEASDGTSCGPNDCVSAQVCMAGVCVTRPSPEGSSCGSRTPCRGPGACHGSTCVLPPPGPPTLRWSYSPAPGMALGFRGLMDDSGNSYFLETSTAHSELVSLDSHGATRFRTALPVSCATCGAYTDVALVAGGKVVVWVLSRRAMGVDAATGAVLWTRDLTANVPVYDPQPDGGGSFWCTSPVGVGGGLVAIDVQEGYTDHHSYLVALDAFSGQQQWRVHKKGHVYGAGATGTGDLWLTSANCWAPVGELIRVDPGGSQRATRQAEFMPVAYGATEAWGWQTASSGVGWLVSGTMAETPLVLPYGSFVDSSRALFTADRLLFVSSGPSPRLYDVNPVGAQVRWTRALTPVPQSWSLALGADRSVLALESFSDGGVALLLDEKGDELYRCVLPQLPESPPAVVQGRYLMQLGNELRSLELPGFDMVTPGWSGERGGLSRSRRAR